MRTLVLAGLCILGGCGTAPPESAPVAPAPALAASPATQNVASQTAAPADKKEGEFKPPAGYKTKIAGWDLVYCRKTTVLGTRFPKEVCMTEAELKAYLAKNEEMRDDIDSAGRICSQAAGCGAR